MSKRALVVEDDANIAELLRLYLGKDGFDVMIAADGGKAESSFDLFQPDVVLLDIMLPVKDGWEVCRDIRRKSSTPIIMLTAKGETADKISGLEMGADDYVTKPFSIEELLARIRASLRKQSSQKQDPGLLSCGGLTIDVSRHRVTRDGKDIELTGREFSLLQYFMENKTIVLTRDQLLEKVWGYEYLGETNVVDVYVRYLRGKIDDGFDQKLLQTVRGVGYVLRDDA